MGKKIERNFLFQTKKSGKIFIENPLTINTYDIDACHVNNIVYIRWLENLSTILFEEHFHLRGLLQNKIYPVVISTEIAYEIILHLFDSPVGYMHFACCKYGILVLKEI